jgi:hypothetical protein
VLKTLNLDINEYFEERPAGHLLYLLQIKLILLTYLITFFGMKKLEYEGTTEILKELENKFVYKD